MASDGRFVHVGGYFPHHAGRYSTVNPDLSVADASVLGWDRNQSKSPEVVSGSFKTGAPALPGRDSLSDVMRFSGLVRWTGAIHHGFETAF